jgi:hypothetical protein
MTERYLSVDEANREMDFALLDAVERRFHDPDVADNLRAGMAAGKPLPRFPELAKALDTTLDELLKAFLSAVHDRTGLTYEVHGFLFKERTN